MKTPNEVDKKSHRKYKVQSEGISYPSDYLIRKVSGGWIKIRSVPVFISNTLNGYYIGMKVITSAEMYVYFTSVLLGEINLDTFLFSPINQGD